MAKSDPNQLNNMFEEEELLPELAECVVDFDNGISFIKHPLVNMHYMEPLNKQANRMLVAKREHIEKYEKLGNYDGILGLIERPWRWEYLAKYANKMSDQMYWESVSWVWTDTENLWQYQSLALNFMTSDRPGRNEHLMNEEERSALESMENEIKIWRGWNHDEAEFGMSWTIDQEKAEWFSVRLCPKEHTPRVTPAIVKKKEVLAFFKGRNESEIVVDPDTIHIGDCYPVGKAKKPK